jgi:hypothetical protein
MERMGELAKWDGHPKGEQAGWRKKNAAPLGAAVIATLNHIAVPLYPTSFPAEWGKTRSAGFKRLKA